MCEKDVIPKAPPLSAEVTLDLGGD